jgi:DNA-binding MarR family transcriptional regulator
MSVQAITSALATRGLRATDKLLLLALANYADENGKCWPSHKKLSQDTDLSQRTILTAFKRLEAAGVVTREPQKRDDGSRKSDIIHLFPRGERVAPCGEKSAPGGGENFAGGVGKQLQGGGETVAPLTTFEPSKEPSKGKIDRSPHGADPSPDQGEKSAVGKASRKKPSTAIPDNFPDAESIAKAQERLRLHGLNTSAAQQAERFRNHAIQNDRRCVKWGAAFDNWILIAIGDAPIVNSTVVQLVPTIDWERRVKSWFGPNRYWDDDWGPRPGRAGCKAPADLIEVYQNRGAA